MSWTAMWNNKKVRTCAANNTAVSFVCSRMFSPFVEYTTTVLLKNPDQRKNKYGGLSDVYHLPTPEYGKLMTLDEVFNLNRETGRTVPAGRNTDMFVMSRAARKRGYITTDHSYNRKKRNFQA